MQLVEMYVLLITSIGAVSASSASEVHVPLRRHPLKYENLLAARHQRRNRTHVVPLHGGIDRLGEYYMSIVIGGRQLAELQVDTGSSDLGLPAVGCNGCKQHAHPWYDPQESGAVRIPCDAEKLECGSCHDDACAYDIVYADSSGFSAALWTDQIAIDTNGTLTVSSAIGAIYRKRRGEFEPKAVDGIIGFGYQTIASALEPTPFDAWVGAGLVADVFAMCLTSDGGKLVLGGDGAMYSTSAPQYTPIIQETYYVVNMSDLAVGGVSLGLPPSVYNRGDTIVDSGSTDLILPSTAFEALVKNLKHHCKTTRLAGLCGEPQGKTILDGYCFQLSTKDLAAWPSLQIGLDGVRLELPASTYLRQACDDGGEGGGSAYFTASIDVGDDGDGTILGDVVMKPYNVIFDRARKRVGFSPAACADPVEMQREGDSESDR
jgi:hypothetical protein